MASQIVIAKVQTVKCGSNNTGQYPRTQPRTLFLSHPHPGQPNLAKKIHTERRIILERLGISRISCNYLTGTALFDASDGMVSRYEWPLTTQQSTPSIPTGIIQRPPRLHDPHATALENDETNGIDADGYHCHRHRGTSHQTRPQLYNAQPVISVQVGLSH